jgi:predicted CXXCH cytochrome family protein
MKSNTEGLHHLQVLGLCLLACAAVVLAWPAAGQASIDDSQCIECHDEIDYEAYAASAHGKNACNSCHFDVIDIDDHEACGAQNKVETCHRCHPDEGREHFASVHMINDIKCADCHSDPHAITKWSGAKQDVVNMCLGCHDGEDYQASVHGRAVAAGNDDAAACTDCHSSSGVHRVEPLGERGTSEFRALHTDTCHRCHADTLMMKRNRVPTIAVITYEESYHGKVEGLGSNLAAGCADCHTAHAVRPRDDPESSINPGHVVETCGACHPGSSIQFAQFLPHADHADRENFPVLYFTWVLMTTLLVSVFAVFWVHTFLWWRKAYWARRESLLAGEYDHHHRVEQPLKPYRRFNSFDKIMHVLMAVSFLGLVLSGLPLKFHAAPWAGALMQLLGGPGTAGLIHRVCAGITFVYFGSVIAYVVYYLGFKDTGETFLQKLLGPDSLVPNLRDVADFRAMFQWFLGRREEPTFERWTYWEKFDFLAVFWGMFAIGGSGLLLWFPEFFAQFMPGWIFNVAIIVHSDEALLATGFIFTVHFFNTHFRPGKFPMDMVIFRGNMPKVEFVEERADWVRRLEETGGLDRLQARPVHPLTDLISHLFGFSALALGLVCIGLIVWGFLAH